MEGGKKVRLRVDASLTDAEIRDALKRRQQKKAKAVANKKAKIANKQGKDKAKATKAKPNPKRRPKPKPKPKPKPTQKKKEEPKTQTQYQSVNIGGYPVRNDVSDLWLNSIRNILVAQQQKPAAAAAAAAGAAPAPPAPAGASPRIRVGPRSNHKPVILDMSSLYSNRRDSVPAPKPSSEARPPPIRVYTDPNDPTPPSLATDKRPSTAPTASTRVTMHEDDEDEDEADGSDLSLVDDFNSSPNKADPHDEDGDYDHEDPINKNMDSKHAPPDKKPKPQQEQEEYADSTLFEKLDRDDMLGRLKILDPNKFGNYVGMTKSQLFDVFTKQLKKRHELELLYRDKYHVAAHPQPDAINKLIKDAIENYYVRGTKKFPKGNYLEIFRIIDPKFNKEGIDVKKKLDKAYKNVLKEKNLDFLFNLLTKQPDWQKHAKQFLGNKWPEQAQIQLTVPATKKKPESPTQYELVNTGPLSGTGRDEGLWTDEIKKIMSKYHDFIGVVPSDMIDVLASKVKKNGRFGFVMNLDPHYKSGSHWVSIFVDARSEGSHSIEYFDSFARDPPESIMKQLKTLADKASDGLLKFKINKVIHQNKNTETCGFHAAKFLIDRLNGKSFSQATGYEDRVKDRSGKYEKEIERLQNQPPFSYVM